MHNFSTRLCTFEQICLSELDQFWYFYVSNNTRQMSGRGTVRSAIKIGMRVRIVLKEHQLSGALTDGVVKDILTNSPNHPHGIKVRLADGRVGRVKEIFE